MTIIPNQQNKLIILNVEVLGSSRGSSYVVDEGGTLMEKEV